jgi:hypothetical protein
MSRMPGVQGTNTSNVTGPSDMEVIKSSSSDSTKMGATPPAKADAQATQKGGNSFADIAKLASETFAKIADVAIAAINKAMPGGGKEADAGAAGNDPAKSEGAADKKGESSAVNVAKDAIAKIVDTFMAAIGKSPAEGKGAEAKGAGKDAEAKGAGKDAEAKGAGKDAEAKGAGKDDVAKAAKDAVNKIETAVSKKSEPAAEKKGDGVFFQNKSESDKPAMGVFEADVAKSAFNAIRDVANAKQAKDTAEA